VQAYHAAAVSAESVLHQFDDMQPGSPFWTAQGSGGRALARLRFLIRRSGDGDLNESSEKIYRSFFRSAYGLLFPEIAREQDKWGVDEQSGEMFAPYKPGEVSVLSGRELRPIEWRDLLPVSR
jgi:hypothetical protein